MPKADRPAFPINPSMLADIGLFGGLPKDALEHLAGQLKTVRAAPGKVVVQEGATEQEMFIVVGGELEVVKSGPAGGEARVALLGPGDWFGEMALLDVGPRSATVRSVASSLLLRITAEEIEALYRQDAKAYALLMMNIARELGRRLRVADGIIAQFMSTVSDTHKPR